MSHWLFNFDKYFEISIFQNWEFKKESLKIPMRQSKYRQHNDQKKRTNNYLQNIKIK